MKVYTFKNKWRWYRNPIRWYGARKSIKFLSDVSWTEKGNAFVEEMHRFQLGEKLRSDRKFSPSVEIEELVIEPNKKKE